MSLASQQRELGRLRASNRRARYARAVVERERPRIEAAAEQRGYNRCLDEHERTLLPPSVVRGADRDALVLGEVPKEWTIRVPIFDGFDLGQSGRIFEASEFRFHHRLQFQIFRAVKQSWTDSRGNVVCWYTWEPAR